MVRRVSFLIPLILISALFLAGCFPRIGVSTSSGSKGKDEFVRGGVVAGFPSIPLYPEAQVMESYGKDGSYGATFSTGDDLAKVVNFYDQGLRVLGWESVLRKQSETNYLFEIKNSEKEGQIIVNTASDGQTTVISSFVGPR